MFMYRTPLFVYIFCNKFTPSIYDTPNGRLRKCRGKVGGIGVSKHSKYMAPPNGRFFSESVWGRVWVRCIQENYIKTEAPFR